MLHYAANLLGIKVKGFVDFRDLFNSNTIQASDFLTCQLLQSQDRCFIKFAVLISCISVIYPKRGIFKKRSLNSSFSICNCTIKGAKCIEETKKYLLRTEL